MTGEIVVVTGANGFLASWIVKQLLERGYNVRGTVRDPSDMRRVGHLYELLGAKERLVLYKAELKAEGAYDEVVAGADYVLHTAAEFVSEFIDPQKEVVDPAVEGTLSVLKAAAKAKSVKKVVYTSSCSAMFWTNRFINRKEDDIMDETWSTVHEFASKDSLQWYHVGKTKAEQAAIEYSKDAPFKFAAILAGTIIGGLLQKSMNWSSNEIKRVLLGIDHPGDHLTIPINTCFMDVEDVALAHILAMEIPEAEGRYLAIETCMTTHQLAVFLAKLYPNYTTVMKPDMKGMDEATFMKPFFKFSNEKLKNLGLKFTPLEESVKKCVKSLEENNMI